METEKSVLDEYGFDLEQAEETANCQENWTLVFMQRMKNQDLIEKWFAYRAQFFRGYRGGERVMEDLKFNFPLLVSNVFKKTDVSFSYETAGQKPHNVGFGRYGSSGTIFYDATYKDGTPLSVKDKERAEAHEKAHGVLNSYNEREIREILSGFDVGIFKKTEYKDSLVVYELVARMTQIKNYFGMVGNDTFTKAHLDYAREHYLKDVVFDNNMTEFFNSITPEKEKKFLEIINSIAC